MPEHVSEQVVKMRADERAADDLIDRTDDIRAGLRAMRDEVQDMGRDLGITDDRLAKYGQNAARLGDDVDQLADMMDQLRQETNQAADALEDLDQQAAKTEGLDTAAQRARQQAEASRLYGDVESRARAITGAVGYFGAEGIERQINISAEVLASVEAVGLLRQELPRLSTNVMHAVPGVKQVAGAIGEWPPSMAKTVTQGGLMVGTLAALAGGMALFTIGVNKVRDEIEKSADETRRYINVQKEYAEVIATGTRPEVEEAVKANEDRNAALRLEEQALRKWQANYDRAKASGDVFQRGLAELNETFDLNIDGVEDLKKRLKEVTSEIDENERVNRKLEQALQAGVTAARDLVEQERNLASQRVQQLEVDRQLEIQTEQWRKEWSSERLEAERQKAAEEEAITQKYLDLALQMEAAGVGADLESAQANLQSAYDQLHFIEELAKGWEEAGKSLDEITITPDMAARWPQLAEFVNMTAEEALGQAQVAVQVGEDFIKMIQDGAAAGDIVKKFSDDIAYYQKLRAAFDEIEPDIKAREESTQSIIDHTDALKGSTSAFKEATEQIIDAQKRMKEMTRTGIEGRRTLAMRRAGRPEQIDFGTLYERGTGGLLAQRAGLAQEELKVADKRLDILRDFRDDAVKIEADHALDLKRDAEDFHHDRALDLTEHYRDLADLDTEFYQDRADLLEDISEDLADIDADRLDEIKDRNKEQQREAQDHARRLVEIERDMREGIEDAAAQLDARTVVSLKKQGVKRLRDEKDQYDLEQARREEDFQDRLDELDELRNERLQAGQQALIDLQEQHEEERQQTIADWNRRLAEEDYQREVALQRQREDWFREDQERQQVAAARLQELGYFTNNMLSMETAYYDSSLDLTDSFLNGMVDRFGQAFSDINTLASNLGAQLSNLGSQGGQNASDLGALMGAIGGLS